MAEVRTQIGQWEMHIPHHIFEPDTGPNWNGDCQRRAHQNMDQTEGEYERYDFTPLTLERLVELIPRTVDKQVRKRAPRFLILAALARLEPSPTTLIWIQGLLCHPEWYRLEEDSCVIDQLPLAFRAQQADWYLRTEDLKLEVFDVHWILRNRRYGRQYLVAGGRFSIPISKQNPQLIETLIPDWRDELPEVDQDVNIRLWQDRPEELILLDWDAQAPFWSRWSQDLWRLTVKVRYGRVSELNTLIENRTRLDARVRNRVQEPDTLRPLDSISICLEDVVEYVELFRKILRTESNYILCKFRPMMKNLVLLLQLGETRLDMNHVNKLLQLFPFYASKLSSIVRISEILPAVPSPSSPRQRYELQSVVSRVGRSQILNAIEDGREERDQKRQLEIWRRRTLRRQKRDQEQDCPTPPSPGSPVCDPACRIFVVGRGMEERCQNRRRR